jgi:hypothetical protein
LEEQDHDTQAHELHASQEVEGAAEAVDEHIQDGYADEESAADEVEQADRDFHLEHQVLDD